MNQIKYNDNDELSALDVWNFLKRQYKIIILIFVVSFSLVIIFLLTRPTLNTSHAILLFDKDVETSDQIKHLYSSEKIIINPIKNTAIIKITSISSESKDSITTLERTIENIIFRQNELLANRKVRAINLLKATECSTNKEFINYVIQFSNQSSANQYGPITLNTLTYSGLMEKGFWLGLSGSIFLALFVAIGFEFMAKIRKSIKTL